MATPLKYLKSNTQFIVMDILRVYLGLSLIVKALYFMSHMKELAGLTERVITYADFFLTHYIVWAHLIGGVFITIGLKTKIASLVNIPVLFGAVFFVHANEGFFSSGFDLGLSLIIFILLLVFSIYGSGKISLDSWTKRKDEFNSDDEEFRKLQEYITNKRVKGPPKKLSNISTKHLR